MDSSSGRQCGRKARRVQYIKTMGNRASRGLRLCNSANRPTSKFRLPIGGGSHHDMNFLRLDCSLQLHMISIEFT
jgi:hypothetical protein